MPALRKVRTWLPLLAAARLWGGHGFGETVTVENRLGTMLSPGWVVIQEARDGPRFLTPHVPTRFFMTLLCLRGAPVGAVVEVLGHSPIPPGWVKVGIRGNQGLDRRHYNLRFRIEKLFDADGAQGEADLPPVTHAPLELDIATLDPHARGRD